MPGPGEYRPDPTVGIDSPRGFAQDQGQRPEPQLPPAALPALRSQRLPRSARPPHPPRPGQPPHRAAPRHRPALLAALLPPLPQVLQRRLLRPGRPRQPLHPPGRRRSPSGWSSRTAYPIAPPNGPSGATTACSSPTPRSRTGSRPGGKRRRDGSTPSISTGPSPTSRAIIAVDELYDGPFCILSIVDNRTFKRLAYQVLDHDPTHTDIAAFFRRFHAALDGPRADPPGDHDRRLGAVSRADRRGLRRRPASALHLPHRPNAIAHRGRSAATPPARPPLHLLTHRGRSDPDPPAPPSAGRAGSRGGSPARPPPR